MAAQPSTIKYAKQWGEQTIDHVSFSPNNLVGNFAYPKEIPAYKPIVKYLYKCPLKRAFVASPETQYTNLLKEFWCTTHVTHPNPKTISSKSMRDSLIHFTSHNGTKSLTLDFATFVDTTGLDYNKEGYTALPDNSVVKEGLRKLEDNPSSLDQAPVQKKSFPAAWKILITFVIQVRWELFFD